MVWNILQTSLVLIGLLLICVFIILNYLIRKNFYDKKLTDSDAWVGQRILLLPLFFPKIYFPKRNFWKGYLLYILNLFVFIVILLVFYLLFFMGFFKFKTGMGLPLANFYTIFFYSAGQYLLDWGENK